MKIELSEEEIDVLDFHVFKSIIRLEDAKLTDSRCYPQLVNVHRKLSQLKKQCDKQDWLL